MLGLAVHWLGSATRVVTNSCKAQGRPCHMACEATNSCGEWSDMSMLENLALNQHATAQRSDDSDRATVKDNGQLVHIL